MWNWHRRKPRGAERDGDALSLFPSERNVGAARPKRATLLAGHERLVMAGVVLLATVALATWLWPTDRRTTVLNIPAFPVARAPLVPAAPTPPRHRVVPAPDASAREAERPDAATPTAPVRALLRSGVRPNVKPGDAVALPTTPLSVAAGPSRPSTDAAPLSVLSTVPAGEPEAGAVLSAAVVPMRPAAENAEAIDRLAIDRVLDTYRQSYSALDADMVSTIWQGLDTPALERAFSGLSSQRLSFDRCDVRLGGDVASALCTGVLDYVRKIGQAQPQSRRLAWTIDLRRAGDRWLISGVNAR